MNVGQVFELLMGWAASNLNCRVKVVPFDEMYGAEKSHQTVQAFLEEASKQPGKAWVYNPQDPGKLLLKDGRTQEALTKALDKNIGSPLKGLDFPTTFPLKRL